MNPTEAIQKLLDLGFTQTSIEKMLGLRQGKVRDWTSGRSPMKSCEQDIVIKGIESLKKEIEKIEIDIPCTEAVYSVYVHIFPNEKRYYGISKNPKNRWGKDGNGYQDQEKLWEAIQEFGWDNIKHEIIIENLTQENALMIEAALINQYKTNIPACGYNTLK